jgi:hypothetical protein
MGQHGVDQAAQEHQSSVGLFIQTILGGKTSLPLSLPAISSTDPGALPDLRIHAHLPRSDAKEAHRVT